MGEVGGRWAGAVCNWKLCSRSPEPRGRRRRAAGAGCVCVWRGGSAVGKPAPAHPLQRGQTRTFEGSLCGPGRGSRYPPRGPQSRTTQPSNTRRASTPPKTILLIGGSAPGMLRAAAGGPAVPSRSRPARAGEGVGRPACSRGSRGPRGGARRAGCAAGGGAPGSAAAPAPPAAGARPEQKRSAALLCARSAVLLSLLLLRPVPSAAAPAAGSSSLSPRRLLRSPR